MRLDREQIRALIQAHNRGVAHGEIAATLSVDVSTVRYHVEKTERLYGTTIGVYAVVQPKKACEHPSMKCLVCGKAQDAIHRREIECIHRLTSALEQANERLTRYGYEPVEVS